MNRRPVILVVEDNPITRKMVRVALTTEGYEVREAADGATAIGIVQAEAPDLVLQDLLLPDTTGFDMIRRLRAIPGTGGMPVLAFTGFLSRDEEARVVDAGFDGLLIKPVAPSELLRALAIYLAKPAVAKRPGDAMGRVLLVDDDPVQLKLVRLYLQHAGFEVEAVSGGEAALAAARARVPDAVVSDVLMPGMDGFQLCAAIRAEPATSRIPVVLTSSKYVEEADRDLGRMAGAQEFIQRTPDPRELFEALNRAASVRVVAPKPGAWDQLRHVYLARVVAQLERQALANAGLIQRASVLGASLSVIAAVSTSLAERVVEPDGDLDLETILHNCIEAAGLSRGAVFLKEEGSRWTCAASLGFEARGPEALEALVRDGSVLNQLTPAQRSLVFPSGTGSDPEESNALLDQLAASSAIVAGLTGQERTVGALLLTSADRNLSGDEWRAFAEAVAANVGQALALSQAVRDLNTSEERYRVRFENSPIAKYVSTPDGRLLDANAALVSLLGYPSKSALLKVPVGEHYVNDSERRRWREALVRVGHVRDAECELRRLDGRSIWVSLSALMVRGNTGEPERFEGALVDVTERRLATEQLRESEQRFREISDNVREVFFVVDPVTALPLYMSPSYAAVFGQSIAQAMSAPLAFMGNIHPDDQLEVLERFKTAATGVDPGHVTYRIVRDDGTTGWLVVRPTLVRDPSGVVVRLVGIVEDVTELKRTEAQYLHSQKMEAIGLLAGGIAHDFNNLLTVIKSYGGMLLDEIPKTDPHRELVEDIALAGDRAERLTRQLLAFSRRQVVDPKVLDLRVIVAELQRMLARLVTERITFQVVIAMTVDAIRADAGQLEQAIVNLVVNARDALPDRGTVTLSVSNEVLNATEAALIPRARPGNWVRVRVRDTGTGMDAATKERMFEPFFTTKAQGSGTGLGLSTTFGIVEQSGGFIAVESAPGRGTTVDLFFPSIGPVVEVELLDVAKAPRIGGTEHVFVVEDEPAVRNVVLRTLKAQGYELTDARNGAEALAIASTMTEQPELLVTDMIMPRMGGSELAAQLRKRWPTLKVLLMSGYTTEPVSAANLAAANGEFIEKPFHGDDLALKVRQVLDAPTKAQTAMP